MNFDLMVPGLLVFSLIFVGVVLTIFEFKKMEREEEKEAAKRSNRSENE
jgi:cbb3-type cytochrome oxidase subunit 3